MPNNDDNKNEKKFSATVNRKFINNKSSDRFGWRCRLMNRQINNNQTSIKHATAAAIDDTWWWLIEHKVRSGRSLNVVSIHHHGWGNGHPTRVRRVDGEATSWKALGNVRANGGGGVLPIALGVVTYRGPLRKIFYIRSPPLSAVFGSIIISWFFLSHFGIKAAQFFGAARVGDVPHVIQFVVFRGVLLFLCSSVRVQETNPPPPPPHQGLPEHAHVRQRRGVSCEGRYMFSIPWTGAVLLGVYIYIGAFVEHSPSWAAPWDERLMMNGSPFFILIQGDLSMDRCHHATRQMVKIQRLGNELPMVTAIQKSGHTRGRWGNR